MVGTQAGPWGRWAASQHSKRSDRDRTPSPPMQANRHHGDWLCHCHPFWQQKLETVTMALLIQTAYAYSSSGCGHRFGGFASILKPTGSARMVVFFLCWAGMCQPEWHCSHWQALTSFSPCPFNSVIDRLGGLVRVGCVCLPDDSMRWAQAVAT